jgi:hypothetical protein
MLCWISLAPSGIPGARAESNELRWMCTDSNEIQLYSARFILPQIFLDDPLGE